MWHDCQRQWIYRSLPGIVKSVTPAILRLYIPRLIYVYKVLGYYYYSPIMRVLLIYLGSSSTWHLRYLYLGILTKQ